LRAAIGGRHRSAEDDEGLPRSPINATPTTAQVLVDYSVCVNVKSWALMIDGSVDTFAFLFQKKIKKRLFSLIN
jgi:hypothetical protein